MTFDVTADAYGRFMGRFSEPLADELLALVDPRPGQRALDVGCGPGALAARLVERLGPRSVSALDPSPPFVAAARSRLPGVDVREAAAEALPYADGGFDLCLSQLVVHFMADPVAGLREMARVTRTGGLIGASVWDHSSTHGPLSLFWRAVHDLDPTAPGEASLPGVRSGELARLFDEAGLTDPRQTTLRVRVPHASFEEWWEPYTLGVGPAGGFVAALPDDERARLRDHCAELLPAAPFTVTAEAWCVTARA